jgi:hypothetical protein
MHDELSARQRAISLRLAGRSVKYVCAALGRVEAWFYKWWRRYLEDGPGGLYDLTRANHHVAQRIPPELERTILSVRRRLQAHVTPATRYCLTGATAILSELNILGIRPLPSERTIERVLERNGLTAPRVRLVPLLPRQEYPGPQARASNDLHEVDLVGPVYLKGSGHRHYIWVGKDAFDGAVCLRLAGSRRMDEVLGFLGACWQDLGIPEQVQFDNARELAGWGPAAAIPGARDSMIRAFGCGIWQRQRRCGLSRTFSNRSTVWPSRRTVTSRFRETTTARSEYGTWPGEGRCAG